MFISLQICSKWQILELLSFLIQTDDPAAVNYLLCNLKVHFKIYCSINIVKDFLNFLILLNWKMMKHFRVLKLFNTDFKYIINQNHSPHFLALEQSKACFFHQSPKNIAAIRQTPVPSSWTRASSLSRPCWPCPCSATSPWLEWSGWIWTPVWATQVCSTACAAPPAGRHGVGCRPSPPVCEAATPADPWGSENLFPWLLPVWPEGPRPGLAHSLVCRSQEGWASWQRTQT